MGKLSLDIPFEGVFPFHNIEDDAYFWGLRFSPRAHYKLSTNWKLTAGPAFQFGREDAFTATKLRFFRVQPDPRLQLAHLNLGSTEFRFDVPEAFLQYRINPRWQLRFGRNYWDNTIQRRFRDWSNEGVADGNIGDAPISLGAGGDVRYFKPWTRDVPVDLKLSGSIAVGSKGEALGLVQGLASFLPVSSSPDSVTVLGASLGYAHYPAGALPALLPGIPQNAEGDGVSVGGYLQQGLGANLDLQVGYSAFLPTVGPDDPARSPLKKRSGLNVSADYHRHYWGIHAQYGKVWRDDLAGATGTKTEDILGLAGRWMVMGDKNRNVNLTLGATTAFSEDQIRWGVFGGVEINVQGIHP